jgi:hypothetical protein
VTYTACIVDDGASNTVGACNVACICVYAGATGGVHTGTTGVHAGIITATTTGIADTVVYKDAALYTSVCLTAGACLATGISQLFYQYTSSGFSQLIHQHFKTIASAKRIQFDW